jgi:hypothetical protein
MPELLSHPPFHNIDVVLYRAKLTTGQVKLVYDLVASLTELSTHQLVKLLKKMFAFGTVKFGLPLLEIENMPVLHGHYSCCVATLTKFFFSVFN